jgi:hypothetical protein
LRQRRQSGVEVRWGNESCRFHASQAKEYGVERVESPLRWTQGAISGAKKWELSEVSELTKSSYLGSGAGGSVRLKRPMRPKSPYRAGKGWGDMLFCNQSMMVFARGRPVSGHRSWCGAKLSKSCQSQEDTHWAHPCSLRNHLLTLRASLGGEEIQSGKRGKSVSLNNEQLTMAEKGRTRKRS